MPHRPTRKVLDAQLSKADLPTLRFLCKLWRIRATKATRPTRQEFSKPLAKWLLRYADEMGYISDTSSESEVDTNSDNDNDNDSDKGSKHAKSGKSGKEGGSGSKDGMSGGKSTKDTGKDKNKGGGTTQATSGSGGNTAPTQDRLLVMLNFIFMLFVFYFIFTSSKNVET